MNKDGVCKSYYNDKQIDFIIGVIVETSDIYCIPVNKIINKNEITLNPYGDDDKSNKQNPNNFKNKIIINDIVYYL